MTKHYSRLVFSLALLLAGSTLPGRAAGQDDPLPPPPPSDAPSAPTPPTEPRTDAGRTNGGEKPKKKPKAVLVKTPVKAESNPVATARAIKVSLDNLVSGYLDVPASSLQSGAPPPDAPKCQVSGALSEGGAKVRLDLSRLRADGTQCRNLIDASPKLTPVTVTVGTGATAQHIVLELSPDVGSELSAAIELKVSNGEVTPANATALSGSADVKPALYWLNGSQWQKVKADSNDKLKLPDDLASQVGQSKQPYNVFVNFNGNGFISGVTRAVLPAGAAPRAIRGKKDNGKKPVRPPGDWCRRNPVGYTVCLDFYDNALKRKNRRVSVYPNDTNHVLRPNTSIRVVVLRRAKATVTMELGGEQGVFVSTDRNLTQTPGLDQHSDQDEQDKPDFDIDEQEFAPRLPGNANLTVTLTEDGEEQSRTVEFIVETTYIGAVRVGAALVFNATDRSYEARAVADSKQSEIAVSKKSSQDLELVVGYSAYLSPRGYANPSWSNFEPYVGIGVLNQGPTALETLKSLHFGLEWEPSPNFGIAFTGVVRRVDRLADGYRIGSPISGSVPTVEKAELGFGIVFNLSPDFLRIAKQSGSTFFK
jgi:hypothetical protein